RLGAGGGAAAAGIAAAALPARWLDALAQDLQAQRGTSLVVVGTTQPAWMHALGHAMNQALGNVGQTVEYLDPVEKFPAPGGTLADLAAAMHAGTVDTVLALDVNPVYDAPADLGFVEALRKVPHLLHLGLYRDETARRAEWHVPQALVRRQWRSTLPSDADWSRALQAGFIEHTAAAPQATPNFAAAGADAPRDATSGTDDAQALELLFRPDPTVDDGRWANNGWLQELPKPLNKLTWDNAALISPALAEQRQLANGDMVELALDGRKLEVPVWIMPGQAARSVTLHLGYGREAAGHVGDGQGFNA